MIGMPSCVAFCIGSFVCSLIFCLLTVIIIESSQAMAQQLNDMSPAPAQETPTVTEVAPVVKVPTSMQIWAACLDDLTGKDKLAKMVQYALRMLGAVDNMRTGGNGTQLVQLSTAVGVLGSCNRLGDSLLIIISRLVKKLSGFLNALSAYRQLLRAGTLPFRFHRLISQLKKSFEILTSNKGDYAVRMNKVTNFWISWDMLSQLINLQYALADETILAFKLNLIDNVQYKGLLDIAEDHEVWSWFVMIILGLRKDLQRWNDLSKQEGQLLLNEKVKSQTQRIVQQMKSNPMPTPVDLLHRMFVDNVNVTDKIRSLWQEKHLVLVDAVRLLCDLGYDFPFVARISVSRTLKPLHLLLGVFSGILGFYKVWVAQRDRLTAQLNEI